MSNDNTLKTPTDPTPRDPIDPPSTSDFDFEGLGLPQNFQQMLQSRKVWTTIPLRKPHKHEWVRCHPEWERTAAALKLPGDHKDDVYILHKDLIPTVPLDLITCLVFIPTITRQMTPLFWPIRVPQSDARHEEWGRSALALARKARTRWIQLHADMGLGAYVCRELQDQVGEPEWPDLTWPALQELAFRERYITTLEHPILLEILRGK